jgi:hypothetical protein
MTAVHNKNQLILNYSAVLLDVWLNLRLKENIVLEINQNIDNLFYVPLDLSLNLSDFIII